MSETTWRVVWVERHEFEVVTEHDEIEKQRSDVWARVGELGVHRDQIVAFYQSHTTT